MPTLQQTAAAAAAQPTDAAFDCFMFLREMASMLRKDYNAIDPLLPNLFQRPGISSVTPFVLIETVYLRKTFCCCNIKFMTQKVCDIQTLGVQSKVSFFDTQDLDGQTNSKYEHSNYFGSINTKLKYETSPHVTSIVKVRSYASQSLGLLRII